MHLRTAFLWVVIVSLGFSALLGTAAVLYPYVFGSSLEELIFGSSLLTGLFSALALGCSIVMGRRRLVPVMWIGIAASGLALLGWLALIWTNTPWLIDPWWLKLKDVLTVLAIWATHLGILSIPTLHRRLFRVVRATTLVIAGLLGLVIILVILAETEMWKWGAVVRTMWALAILASCGTVVSPVLALVEFIQRTGRPRVMDGQAIVSVTCPRCAAALHVACGLSRCGSCGLKITIDVKEPHCACGNLLEWMVDDRCPECGRAIPEEDRWLCRREEATAPKANAPD